MRGPDVTILPLRLPLTRLLALSAALLIGLAPARSPAQDDGAPAPQGAEDPLVRVAEVPLRDGTLDLAELGRALLEAYGLDASGLEIPSRTVDLRGAKGPLLFITARKLLLDTVSFRQSADGQNLAVRIDRTATRKVRRLLRSRVVKLLGGLIDEDLLARSYELALPPELAQGRRLVVLVHGVESSPAVFSDLRAFLSREPGRFQVATFAYPDDESVERIATALAAELRALGEQPVAIVGHSMGALVARAVVEDPKLDPGNIDTVILIGAPNHGSRLAGLRFGLEAAHLLRETKGAEGVDEFGRALLDGLRQNLLDGLGEAGGDLLPDSVFLTELDRRARNERVAYHLVLGTRSVLTEAELATVRERGIALLGDSKAARLVRPKLEAWLADLDELVDGQGDGAVSVARGRLEGIDPVLVPLDHVGLIRLGGVLGRTARPADHPVFAHVARWLGEAR